MLIHMSSWPRAFCVAKFRKKKSANFNSCDAIHCSETSQTFSFFCLWVDGFGFSPDGLFFSPHHAVLNCVQTFRRHCLLVLGHRFLFFSQSISSHCVVKKSWILCTRKTINIEQKDILAVKTWSFAGEDFFKKIVKNNSLRVSGGTTPECGNASLL